LSLTCPGETKENTWFHWIKILLGRDCDKQKPSAISWHGFSQSRSVVNFNSKFEQPANNISNKYGLDKFEQTKDKNWWPLERIDMNEYADFSLLPCNAIADEDFAQMTRFKCYRVAAVGGHGYKQYIVSH